MKCPSSRNNLPKGTLSLTSTIWNGERKRSNWRDARTKKPHSSVRCSVIAPGTMSPPGLSVASGGILASAMDRMEFHALRLQRRLERAEQPFRLRRIVGRQVAHVHVDADEAVLRPCVNGEMRFGEEHRTGDALGRELVEALTHHGETRVG